MRCNSLAQFAAAILVVSVQGLAIPVSQAAVPASLSGTLVRSSDRTPLVGAKLHVGNPSTGRILSSAPTNPEGAFRVEGLDPATYQLAVELAGGLYVVDTPVRLAPGQAQILSVAIAATTQDEGGTAPGGTEQSTKPSMWQNPLTAALIVLGAAIVVGYVVDQATDDNNEDNSSPSQ